MKQLITPTIRELPVYDDFMSEFEAALPTEYPLISSLDFGQGFDDVLFALRVRHESVHHLYAE